MNTPLLESDSSLWQQPEALLINELPSATMTRERPPDLSVPPISPTPKLSKDDWNAQIDSDLELESHDVDNTYFACHHQKRSLRENLNIATKVKSQFLRERHSHRVQVRRFILDYRVQFCYLVLVIFDFVLLFWKQDFNNTVTLVIVFLYLFEILALIYSDRWAFWVSPINLVETLIVFSSLFLCFFYSHERTGYWLVRAARWARLVRVSIKTLTLLVLKIPAGLRYRVRNNKQSYKSERFDLDLCYITDRIIAMSLPASGAEGIFRNPKKTVKKFFDENHPNAYQIYDLCQERWYDDKVFDKRVRRFRFPDHSVPSLYMILDMIEDVNHFLDCSDSHVVAVHCRGGKGRTGTMVASIVINRYQNTSPGKAINHFACMRTDQTMDGKVQGIQTPSQMRFVRYYYQLFSRRIRKSALIYPRSILCNYVIFGPVFDAKSFVWSFHIRQWIDGEPESEVFDISTTCEDGLTCEVFSEDDETQMLKFKGPENQQLQCNICFELRRTQKNTNKSETVGACWFHTLFLQNDSIKLGKFDIDGASKDRKHKKLPADFRFQAEIQQAPEGGVS